MADTITFWGLTGVKGTVFVDRTTDTFDSLITLIAAAEGLPTDYYTVSLQRDPSKNSLYFADSSSPLTLDDVSIGMTATDVMICALNTSGLTKQQRQIQKLEIAQVKRQAGGDTAKPYYRGGNIYDLTALPDTYNGNFPEPDDNPNAAGLLQGRPWTGVASVELAITIEEALPANVLVELESWYDGSDPTAFIPGNPDDGDTFTQWTDKSAFAHNANPYGGAVTRARYETNELNSLSVVRFDGNDGLTINPYPGLVNATAITLFAVAKLSATAGYPKLFGQAQSFDMFYSTDTNSWRFNVAGAGGISSTGADDGAFHIHTIAFDGTQNTNATRFKYRRDKANNTLNFGITPVGTTIGSTSQLDIGFYSGGPSQFMTGDIAEFLVFTKVLTATEIANVENYLSNKWGLGFTFYEAFGTTTAISITKYVSGNKIYAESSTYDVPNFQPARIIVNDVQIVNTELRGHTLLVLNSSGNIVTGPTQYDTYIDPANVTALANALNAVASGNIVVLVVYDASAVDAAVRSAINTGYGSTNTDTWTAQRKSHIFIGVKS